MHPRPPDATAKLFEHSLTTSLGHSLYFGRTSRAPELYPAMQATCSDAYSHYRPTSPDILYLNVSCLVPRLMRPFRPGPPPRTPCCCDYLRPKEMHAIDVRRRRSLGDAYRRVHISVSDNKSAVAAEAEVNRYTKLKQAAERLLEQAGKREPQK